MNIGKSDYKTGEGVSFRTQGLAQGASSARPPRGERAAVFYGGGVSRAGGGARAERGRHAEFQGGVHRRTPYCGAGPRKPLAERSLRFSGRNFQIPSSRGLHRAQIPGEQHGTRRLLEGDELRHLLGRGHRDNGRGAVASRRGGRGVRVLGRGERGASPERGLCGLRHAVARVGARVAELGSEGGRAACGARACGDEGDAVLQAAEGGQGERVCGAERRRACGGSLCDAVRQGRRRSRAPRFFSRL